MMRYALKRCNFFRGKLIGSNLRYFDFKNNSNNTNTYLGDTAYIIGNKFVYQFTLGPLRVTILFLIILRME